MIKIEKLKAYKPANELEKEVKYILLSYADTDEELTILINDILNYGCQSGIIGELIYYKDTLAFYERHKFEINNLLKEILSETGSSCPAEILQNWDNEDPLALEINNRNLLVWFGFEAVVGNLALELEE